MCISLYRTFSCNMKMMYHVQAHERWLYILINERTRQQRINRTMVTSREMKGCGVRLEWRQRIVTNIRRLYVNFVIGKKEMMEQSFARNNIETSFYLLPVTCNSINSCDVTHRKNQHLYVSFRGTKIFDCFKFSQFA